MRIVAGKLRGRRLIAPPDQRIRPSSDRLREALFNILNNYDGPDGRGLPAGAVVIDAFAGTGALGLEALSRGARQVFFVERERAALTLIERNLSALGVGDAAQVISRDARRPGAAPEPADLLLLDPPYGENLGPPALTAFAAHNWLRPGALCVLETAKKDPVPVQPGFDMIDTRNYGRAKLTFLRFES